MFKVYFTGILVFQSQSDVDAVSFALALHQQSNVSHIIDVSTSVDADPICSLNKD